MKQEHALIIHEVAFNGDQLEVIEQNGEFFVTMKPLCERMGLDWESQRQLIQRDPVLNSTACIIQAVGKDGKLREMLSLPMQYLNGWLFKVDVARYKDELRDKLIRYQKECYEVLFKHFFGAEITPIQTSLTGVQTQ